MHLPRRLAASLFAFLFASVLAGSAHAQPPAEPAPMTAVKLAPGERIRMDGTLFDPAWQRAPVFKDFMVREPQYGHHNDWETRVQVLYDDRALYVGITALDPQPELIRDPPVRNDLVLRTQDHVVVYIDPLGKKQSAQFFRISASGSTADGMQTAADDSEDFAPDFDFDAAAKHNAQGYTVVLRVPFASLRYTREMMESSSHAWRIMVVRRVPRDQFWWITSVPLPLEVPTILANMQELRGIELPKNSSFLTVRPSFTLRHNREQDTAGAVTTGNKLQTTLDMKWRATPELVIDGTLRPDFSQVDLDVPQLGGNTQYALFFPEKRPFFFEATDVMRAPIDNALYTRTFTEPRWGLRATWRGLTNAGTAIGVDDKGGGLVLLPGPYATTYAVQPGSRTIAARELADVGPLQVGGLVAARKYEHDIGENIVAGPDLSWQVTDTLRLRTQWLRSHTTAQPDASGALVQGPATDGDRVFFRAVNQTPRDTTELTLNDIGEGFRHDTGFVNQVGVRSIESRYGFPRRQWGPFNEIWFNISASHWSDRRTGETVKTDIYPWTYFNAAKNTQVTAELHGLLPETIRASSGAPLLHEKFLYVAYSTTPALWIPLVDSNIAIGRLGDVLANEVRPGVRLNLMVRTRPMNQFEVEPHISYATLYKGGQQTYRETAVQLNSTWFFNANQNIRFILQRTLLDRLPETGVAEEHDRGKVASVTYTWRKSMGTVLYVGASYNKSALPLPSLTRGLEAFVKLQFDVDEVRRGVF
ncbi:MAG TPA: sugar-binding protein [Ramlibacter sp.]|nr:sugar-binding protein [Ramlibacter sp.]